VYHADPHAGSSWEGVKTHLQKQSWALRWLSARTDGLPLDFNR